MEPVRDDGHKIKPPFLHIIDGLGSKLEFGVWLR